MAAEIGFHSPVVLPTARSRPVVDVIGNPGFHRWRHPKRLVDPGEIVVHEVERFLALVRCPPSSKALVDQVKRRMLIRIVEFGAPRMTC